MAKFELAKFGESPIAVIDGDAILQAIGGGFLVVDNDGKVMALINLLPGWHLAQSDCVFTDVKVELPFSKSARPEAKCQ